MTGKRVSAALTVLLIGLGWFFLAPPALGGNVDYVVTHGSSMQPRFHTGDLAVVRPAAHYRVGEIVAYRSRTLHTVVLHRIVGRDGSAYVFKGDRNTWFDPDHPHASDLLGRLWLRVPHGGVVLQWLHRPPVAAGVAMAAFLLLAGTGTVRRRRRRRSQGGQAMPRVPYLPSPVVGGLAAATVAAAALTGFAFTQPTTGPATARIHYTQQVGVTYDGTTAASTLYPGGQLHNGAPIFRRLVHTVRVHADYRFDAQPQHSVAGTAALTATLNSPTGWQRTVALSPPRAFTGDHAVVSAALDLPKLDRVVARIGTATGMPTSTYSLTVNADVHVHGTLAGTPLGDVTATAPLTFLVDPLRAQAQSAATSPSDGATDPAAGSKQIAGSVPVATTRPATWTVLGRQITVTTARYAAAGLTVFLLLALLIAIRTRPRSDHEADRINAAYRGRLVSISGQDAASQRAVLDVTSIDALARIAERYDRLLLHRREGDVDTYLVDDEGILYRYQARPARLGESRRGGRRRLA